MRCWGESGQPRAGTWARKSQALKVWFNFYWSSLQTPAIPPAEACLESKINTNKIIIIIKKNPKIKNASHAFYLKGAPGAATTGALWFSPQRGSGAPQQRQKLRLCHRLPAGLGRGSCSPGVRRQRRSPPFPICLACRFFRRGFCRPTAQLRSTSSPF